MFDKILNYQDTKDMVKEKGWDGFLDHMGEEEETSFFSCSTSGTRMKSIFVNSRVLRGI